LLLEHLYVEGAIDPTPYPVQRCFYLLSEVFDLKIGAMITIVVILIYEPLS